jgi:hypothetical protein
MKVVIMLALLASGNLFAKTQTCRDAVVDAQKILGNSISGNDFSTMNFEDYNITAAEFNELTSEEQGEIYQQVKPLQVMVDETISDLSRRINYYMNSYYSFFYTDEIAQMQETRDGLRSCSMDE